MNLNSEMGRFGLSGRVAGVPRAYETPPPAVEVNLESEMGRFAPTVRVGGWRFIDGSLWRGEH